MKGRLLDTHTLIWAMLDPEQLGPEACKALKNPRIPVFVSAITFWEISLKYALDKLDLHGGTPEDLLKESIKIGPALPLTVEVAAMAYRLPKHHNDPFDHMLLQQAIVYDLILVSKDSKLKPYKNHGLRLEW